jgi:hypothetical protein
MSNSPPARNSELANISTAPESLLVQQRAHLRKGEQAKERAAQNQKKSEDHFIAADRHLATLKANYAPTWEDWETILKAKIGLSTGRASELMAIADGRKSPEQIRADTAQRMRQLRARQPSSSQGRCDEQGEQPSLAPPYSPAAAPTAEDGPEHRLIATLVCSNPGIRRAAAQLVISGPRRGQFQAAADAVADLYQALARAGR